MPPVDGQQQRGVPFLQEPEALPAPHPGEEGHDRQQRHHGERSPGPARRREPSHSPQDEGIIQGIDQRGAHEYHQHAQHNQAPRCFGQGFVRQGKDGGQRRLARQQADVFAKPESEDKGKAREQRHQPEPDVHRPRQPRPPAEGRSRQQQARQQAEATAYGQVRRQTLPQLMCPVFGHPLGVEGGIKRHEQGPLHRIEQQRQHVYFDKCQQSFFHLVFSLL